MSSRGVAIALKTDSSGECQASVHHAFLFSFKDKFI